MSRSIHDTHRVAQRWWLQAFRNGGELDWHRANAARANIHRQRDIKRRLREQRGRTLQPLLPDDVPIRVEPERAYVHHAVTPDDLREVMRRLPPGRLDGLAAIELCLGGPDRARGDEARDPHTGAPGHELLPGVFAPRVRGIYRETGLLRIHAFVYAAVSPVVATYLRLQTLATFVHELAHHFDFAFRTRGDRWRMDDTAKDEAFARKLALEHVQACVLPYLDARYPDEQAALVAWIREITGIELPLEVVLDDRTSEAMLVDEALLDSFRDDDREMSRIGFAVALHYAGHDAHAEAIARVLLADDAELPPARLLVAGIAIRRGQFDVAEPIARELLAERPDWPSAWKKLGEILRAQSRWDELAALATTKLAGDPEAAVARVHRIRASIALARWDDAAADIETLRADDKRGADVLAAWLVFARGDHRKALDAANRAVKLGGIPRELRAELAAVRCESARALCELRASWELSPDDVAELRSRGLDERLR